MRNICENKITYQEDTGKEAADAGILYKYIFVYVVYCLRVRITLLL
jgi:hypothetical protein